MIEAHDHGSVREIRLARPPANALTPELIVGLRSALVAATSDGATAVVLSGAPGMFSAGLDVPYLLTLDRHGIAGLWRELYGLMQDLAALPVPVAAAITGHAPAGGAVLATFCDRRFMAESPNPEKPYRMGLNEVRVGLPLPPVIYRGLVRIVGERQAARLTTEGLLITAQEALAIGWVDGLLPVAEVVAGAVAWAQGVAALPRTAMLATRALDRAGLLACFAGEEAEQVTNLWFHPETQAGLHALVESLKKRG